MFFSLIIPVYNRPDEVAELLESLSQSNYKESFEIVIVEDGSSLKCEDVVQKYEGKLSISYYYKENSGPGDSRNYGMKIAKGEYFIIFDSDCIIPAGYLIEVDKALKENYVDCFGGPDRALDSFSNIQKAINFAMTSFLTTGGIRGGSEKIDKFQPRSFNMGLSRQAFEASKGFGNIHPGEDPDLYDYGISVLKLNWSQMRMFIIREGLIGINFRRRSINLVKHDRFLIAGIQNIISLPFFFRPFLLLDLGWRYC
jgi:glycosyltransferase involved in cell wall biosynthesis